MTRLAPGQPLAGNLKAAEWNRHVDAAEWYHRNKALGDPTKTFSWPIPSDIVKVKNASGEDLPRGAVVELVQKSIDELDPEHLWFQAQAPDSAELRRVFGILREPILVGRYGECQIAGACIARVLVEDTLHKHARLDTGLTDLVSATSGPVSLIEPPLVPGLQNLAVRLYEEPRIEIVAKTSNKRDELSGYYPGTLLRFDPVERQLVSVASIWLEDMNQV